MTTPLVSVVMPTYNRAHLLRRAIMSVVHQTFPDWELIVVDDGSSDDTPALCRDFERRLPGKFRYIKSENNGASAARNHGVLEARGKYVAFLDSDDVFVSLKLALQLARMQASKARFSFTNHFFFDDEGVITNRVRDFSLMNPGSIYPRLLKVRYNSISTPTVMLDKLTFFRSGGFNTNMDTCEDIDLWFRILKEEKSEILVESLSGVHQRTGEEINYAKVLKSRAVLYERAFSCDLTLDTDFAKELVEELMQVLIEIAQASSLRGVAQGLAAALTPLDQADTPDAAFGLMHEAAKIVLPTRRRGATA
jgi:glycosyltransferase involved in cell wall biosynthesis